ncbi:525_t:CDS:1, partial [Ambispora leptoticha]
LTADLTTQDAKFVVEGQIILTMVNTVIKTINEITTNYESLRDQLDHLTETGSVAPLISEQFAGSSMILPEDHLLLLLWVLPVAQVNYRFLILPQQPEITLNLFLIRL